MTRRVAVIGGGLAGITAALACADAGREVVLYEAARRLGGLTHSFRRGELSVDNGQHVFLRCCTAYQDLLRRLGAAGEVALQPRLAIPVRRPGDRRTSWLRRSTSLPAPAHLAGALLRYRPLSLVQRARCAGGALALRRVDPTADATDQHSFGQWLRGHGQCDAAIDALWDLVGVATLNAPAGQASLALAATVFQRGLLADPSAADIGWSRVPLSRLHGDRARARLAEAGARVRTGTPVRGLSAAGSGWLVRTDDDAEQVDGVVLAAPPAVTERLAPPGLVALPPGWARRLGATAILNAHVVLDRPVLAHPFVAGLGTDIQWVFDRTEASGLSSGQYLAISLSAADHLVDTPTARLRARLLPQLASLLPDLADARVRDFFVTREREATFRQAPGSAASRPGARTASDRLVLAGAWTATGWPATMEGAVRSGTAAAAALLDRPTAATAAPPREGAMA